MVNSRTFYIRNISCISIAGDCCSKETRYSNDSRITFLLDSSSTIFLSFSFSFFYFFNSQRDPVAGKTPRVSESRKQGKTNILGQFYTIRYLSRMPRRIRSIFFPPPPFICFFHSFSCLFRSFYYFFTNHSESPKWNKSIS